MTDDVEYNKLRAEVRCIETMLHKARTLDAQQKLSQRLKLAKAAAHRRLLIVDGQRRAEREAAAQTADKQLLDLLGRRLGHGVLAQFADEAAGRPPRRVALKHRLKAAWVMLTGAAVRDWT